MPRFYSFLKNEACILFRKYTKIPRISSDDHMASQISENAKHAAREWNAAADCGLAFNFRDGRLDRSTDEKTFTRAFIEEVLTWGNQRLMEL